MIPHQKHTSKYRTRSIATDGLCILGKGYSSEVKYTHNAGISPSWAITKAQNTRLNTSGCLCVKKMLTIEIDNSPMLARTFPIFFFSILKMAENSQSCNNATSPICFQINIWKDCTAIWEQTFDEASGPIYTQVVMRVLYVPHLLYSFLISYKKFNYVRMHVWKRIIG